MIIIKGKKYDYLLMNSFFKKMFGVMFMKKNNYLFLFENKKEKKIAIHSFFCYPLFLYFFDKEKKLIEKVKLKPFRIYFPKKRWKYLIESFKELDINENDRFVLDN